MDWYINYRFYFAHSKKINEFMAFGSIQNRNEIYEIGKTTKIFVRHNQYLAMKNTLATDKQNAKKRTFISYFGNIRYAI